LVKIYHNPRCSKSRLTLQLLRDNHVEAEVIEYLESPPDKATLIEILRQLDLPARDLMRKHETEYKQNGLDDPTLSEDQLLDAMIATPKLIERPIVISDKGIAIGRPPENVLKVL